MIVTGAHPGNCAARRVEFLACPEYDELARGLQSEREPKGLGQLRQFVPAQGGERKLGANGLLHGVRAAGEQETRAPRHQSGV